MSGSLVYTTPVMDKQLLFAPVHGIAALTNSSAIDALKSGEVHNELAELHGVLSETPDDVPTVIEGQPEPKFLGIIPTRGCNIGCVYCNFGGPTAEKIHMQPELAVQAVDWMADELVRQGRTDYQVHFFGGEPLISDDIVDIVIHRVRSRCAELGMTPHFEASTNGVFSESRCRFVGEYFDAIVLSFDGPPEFHDRNRPTYTGRPTFDVVARTARRLSELPAELCLRICITQDSVGCMEEMTEWMIGEFSPSVVNFETLTDSELSRNAGLKVPDPFEFSRHCIGAYRVARSHGVEAVYSAAETQRPRLSFCPVGTDSFIVGLDGHLNACYLLSEDWESRGMNLDLGRMSDGTVEFNTQNLERTRQLVADKPRCEGCFCKWTCAGGCHVNHSWPGCSEEYDEFCVQTRIVTACLLLEDLGQADLVDQLLADDEAMMRLGTRTWDVLEFAELQLVPQ